MCVASNLCQETQSHRKLWSSGSYSLSAQGEFLDEKFSPSLCDFCPSRGKHTMLGTFVEPHH